MKSGAESREVYSQATRSINRTLVLLAGTNNLSKSSPQFNGKKSQTSTTGLPPPPPTSIIDMATDAAQSSWSISGSAKLLPRNDNKREINNFSPEAFAVKTGGTDQKFEFKTPRLDYYPV
ncbi:hypothetical protein J6590_046024 [Homalodisca vitripennis]|nr:hypothetical protein J6590_046024 [Homalodisca vitripennis]